MIAVVGAERGEGERGGENLGVRCGREKMVCIQRVERLARIAVGNKESPGSSCEACEVARAASTRRAKSARRPGALSLEAVADASRCGAGDLSGREIAPKAIAATISASISVPCDDFETIVSRKRDHGR